MKNVVIIGGGLAGCEAALQLARHDVPVTLYDMKPIARPAAHHRDALAEIVCSNSLGNLQPSTATGLLKAEMRALDSALLAIAEATAVPAGNALAVDRERFSDAVTAAIEASPLVTRVAADVHMLPEADPILVATGPLTSPGLTQTLQQLVNQQQLYFFDAAAPIVTRDSIDFERAFIQNRYGHDAENTESDTEEGSYINCPLEKDEYLALIDAIRAAEKAPLKDFEVEAGQKTGFFESCLPIEELAARGIDTPRYGPMKPVGIVDPRTGRRPYAVVQLRQDNAEGTLYNLVGFQTNLKWGAQKEILRMIPGLGNADVIRYGVMHRNTYLNSPTVLTPTLQLKDHPHILIAGTLAGVEGYTECIASGITAAQTILARLSGRTPSALPNTTMLGALLHYITRPEATNFQPINSNWGIMPALPEGETFRKRDKAQRNARYAERALDDLQAWQATQREPSLV